MRYTLKRATDADRAFAEQLHEACYRDVVIRQFGAWDSDVQSRFFEQKWQPEHYSIIMHEDEAIGVLAVHDGPDHLFLSEIQICPSHQGRGIGSAIIADLIERGRKQEVPIRLQVLRCSHARTLYDRLGFICYEHTDTHLLFEKRWAYPSGAASAMLLMENFLAANQERNHAAIMQIRRYIPGEEDAIWAVYFGSTRNVVAKEYTPDQVQRWAPDSPDWEKWAGDLARTNPFVVVINGQLVGFAELEFDGHINKFYCHHEFQRQGIGTALFRTLEQEAIRLGLPALFAEVSTTGIKFFVAQGFDIEEERCNIVCQSPARQFIVRKKLIPADVVHENGAD